MGEDDEDVSYLLGIDVYPQFSSFTSITRVLFGVNALESGLLEVQKFAHSVLLVMGWNPARNDRLLWELEQRGFDIHVIAVDCAGGPSISNIQEGLSIIDNEDIDVVIGCGGGG